MWSAVLCVSCVAVFGGLEVQGIAHGHTAPSIPWQAAIYRKGHGDLPICGGTLISEDLVISSAACLADDRGEQEDLKDFIVLLGKRKSSKNIKEETVQEREVKEIILSERYKGNVLSSSSNIALLRLSSSIIPSEAVKPINIDLNQDDRDLEGQHGQIAGWGFTEEGRQSEELKVVMLPYVNFSVCYDSVPNNFRPKLTPDKICAGTLDGAFVCRGDFGSGWTMETPDGEHYLRAVVSEAQMWASFKGQCKKGVAALTSIAAHRDWLRSYLAVSSAVLPISNMWLLSVTVLSVVCKLL